MYDKRNLLTGCQSIFFCLVATLLVRTCFTLTTATPEICRVSRKYANCSNVGYRVGCPADCNVDCATGAGPGMISIGNKGMCLIMSPDENRAKFYDAMTYCEGYGATLAKVLDVADGNAMAYLRSLQSTQNEIRWHIPGTLTYYDGGDGNFTWLDTTTFGDNFWAPSEPSLSADTNYCLVSHANDAYMWEADGACDLNVGFVCVKEPIVTSAL